MAEALRQSRPLHARPMEMADLDEVLAIEKSAYSFPWSRGIFEDCLRGRYHCRVYQERCEILGYSVHSVALDEAHLLNICVRPEYQSMGHGRKMLRNVMEEARAQGAKTLFLEVRLSNKVARALYHSEGFNEVGQRFNYYPAEEGREDALIFACSLENIWVEEKRDA